MHFENLAEVHAGRHAERCEDDINRSAVSHVRHVFGRQNLRDNTLVAVASGQLVAHADIPQLGYLDVNLLQNAGIEFVALLTGKDLDRDDTAALTSFHALGGVFNVAGLLAEKRTEQTLFRRKLRFALGRNFTDQNVAGAHFGADADDAVFGQVFQFGFADVRDIASGHFGTEFGVAHVDGEFFDVDGSEFALLNQAFGDDDGVFVVGARPGHESDQDVLPDGHLSPVGGRGIGQNRSRFHLLPQLYRRALMESGKTVGHGEIDQRIFMFFALAVFDRD